MEECIHRKLWFSTWVKVPPIIGKLRTCWQCGAVKAGSNTVTLAGNYIDMTHTSAPANPDSGLNRIYATDGTTLALRDNSGNVTGLAAGSANFVFEGADTGGGNTDSTSADTVLATISSLSIAATTPFYIFGNWRIEKSGNGSGYLGIMLNSTQVIAGHEHGSKASNSSSDANTSGAFWCYVGPRVSNYLRALGGDINGGDGTQSGFYDYAGGSDMPTATITDVKVTAICSNSDVDLVAIDEVFVYSLGT